MDKAKKSLFFRQSYIDNWDEYQKSLNNPKFRTWDYVIITASNDDQAKSYNIQIENRLKNNLIPQGIKYAILSDPEGKRVGSGGATLNVLKYIKEQEKDKDCFKRLKIFLIHSGGDSKRVPQYSALGKLFSPVPRKLPNGNCSSLFDEFMIGFSSIPSRMEKGMITVSGDCMLLFNPLQIEFSDESAACISFKEDVEIGKNHGVFVGDNKMVVTKFLHKLSVEKLRELGAVNEANKVNLDTGAIIFNSDVLESLFNLMSKDEINIDNELFKKFVNDNVRINFYADFLFPLCTSGTIEEYYKEAPEGKMSDELIECRTQLWNSLHKYKMKLISLSPSEFIHFGTTKELAALMTKRLSEFVYLDWKSQVISNIEGDKDFTCINSLLEEENSVGSGSFIEDSYIKNGTKIGKNCVISNITLENISIPDNLSVHCLKLLDGKFIVRIYEVDDNSKGSLENGDKFIGTTLKDFLSNNNLTVNDIWDSDEHYLWNAKLYKACDTIKESLEFAENLYNMIKNKKSNLELFKNSERMSLFSSFNYADTQRIIDWQLHINNKIRIFNFINSIKKFYPISRAKESFNIFGISKKQYDAIMEKVDSFDFSTKIRIYYYLSKMVKELQLKENLEELCFKTIQTATLDTYLSKVEFDNSLKIAKDEVKVNLPVRVNFGGGVSDAPPYCYERGGTVLNVAIKLNGILPVEVIIKKIEEKCIIFESIDYNKKTKIYDIKSIRDCIKYIDPYCLLKSSLIACGIIPLNKDITLEELLNQFGGGFYMSTNVKNVPRGSGLGTSSILGIACVKALFEFFGKPLPEEESFNRVLTLEQIMSTGGGWQDQIGGAINGFKLTYTDPGLFQKFRIEGVKISEKTLKEFQDRFVLIFSGQRRLARNVLREMVGGYIAGNKESINCIEEGRRIGVLMKFALEKGSINEFADLLNEEWETMKKLDKGTTNTCIEQIFLSIDDLICGKMICGAGGGGFLQVILKEGISRDALENRLFEMFQDSGVEIWDSEILM